MLRLRKRPNDANVVKPVDRSKLGTLWDRSAARSFLADLERSERDEILTARRQLAREEARWAAEPLPNCPACKSRATPEFMDVSMSLDEPQFVIGKLRCSANCWRTDPGRYLAATEAAGA